MCHHKAPHQKWFPDEKHKDLYKDEDIPLPKTFQDDYKGRKMADFAKMRVDSHFCALDLKILPPEEYGFKDFIPLPDDVEGYQLTTDDDETIQFDTLEELREWKYQRYIKDYLRVIASIDDNVGRMLDYLDEEGLTENTIIIYTSDQGFFLGDHGWYDKRFIYEESLRMPLVMRFPKEIPAKSINKEMMLNLDFPETFLDYARIEIPDNMQGKSFREQIRGEVRGQWRDAFYYRYFMMRSQHEVSPHYGIRTKKYKMIYFYANELDPLENKQEIAEGISLPKPDFPEAEWQLFDLEKDPFELNNVYGNKEYLEIQQDLKKRLHQLQVKYGDTPVNEI